MTQKEEIDRSAEEAAKVLARKILGIKSQDELPLAVAELAKEMMLCLALVMSSQSDNPDLAVVASLSRCAQHIEKVGKRAAEIIRNKESTENDPSLEKEADGELAKVKKQAVDNLKRAMGQDTNSDKFKEPRFSKYET